MEIGCRVNVFLVLFPGDMMLPDFHIAPRMGQTIQERKNSDQMKIHRGMTSEITLPDCRNAQCYMTLHTLPTVFTIYS